MRKLTLIIATLAITMLAAVPAFAGPAEEIAAARAEQEKRLADYAAYQERLAAFQAGEVAKGQAALAAGQAAQAANFARIAAFQAGEIAKGEAQRAAGLAAAANNPVIAFQKEQLAKAAAIQAQRAELQKQIDAYLRMF